MKTTLNSEGQKCNLVLTLSSICLEPINYFYIIKVIRGVASSTLCPGWSQDHIDFKKKNLLHINLKNIMIFLIIKKKKL